MLPQGFVYLKDPRILYSMDYSTPYNFVGRTIAGYLAPVCITTEPVAKALIAIQDTLDKLQLGFHLKIFDAYRPATAVQDFLTWSKNPKDQIMKRDFYPNIEKADLFELKYLALRSSHSRGSAVDLTITQSDPKPPKQFKELEMGTPFDFFDEASFTDCQTLSEEAKKNRVFLKELMEKFGLKNYPLEWWHFALEDEPFPDTYFDFPVK